ncbi:hypothetical protein PVAND_003851 [Polypedilum vanderplanki]|uniref:C2H2-type domain-containing protein n=1 Tax=Polypedilum vanderplanki TaxID=319348 RepID=A0A9J6BVA7_POLVA|nr:hypothetical protein PVAND_003851 [Polypedilum vanderplanki]
MINQNIAICDMCYESTEQLFQVSGSQILTCVKCSETLSHRNYYQQQNQSQIHQQQQQQQQQQILYSAPVMSVPMAPVTSNNIQHQGVSHHKTFTSTAATIPISTTLEIEQALMNLDGEILLGDEGKCPLCQKIFNRKTSLLNHIRNHSADKKYVCGYCQKGFSQQANLRNHTRIHTNDRPYVCCDCGKAFTQITNLNNHKRLHTGERPYVCIEIGCGRSFAQVTNLNNHMKTHHKIQQYVCTQCPRKFHTVTQLNHHLATHGIVVKPQLAVRGDYACNLCPASFFEELQLKKHIRKHIEGRVLNCEVIDCNESFSTKNQLMKHMQSYHPNEYHRKKDARHIPISLLQLPSSPKIKIEDDVRIRVPTSSHHISQFPLQLAGRLPTAFQQQSSLNNDALITNDATKKVLSITEIINRRNLAL